MLGLPALTLLLRSQDSLVLDIVVSLYAAVAIIAIASYFSRQGRNLKIQADTRAARLLGREELLQSLRKILQIEQEHPEMAKKRSKFLRQLYLSPSLHERIDNLENV